MRLANYLILAVTSAFVLTACDDNSNTSQSEQAPAVNSAPAPTTVEPAPENTENSAAVIEESVTDETNEPSDANSGAMEIAPIEEAAPTDESNDAPADDASREGEAVEQAPAVETPVESTQG